MLFKRKRVWKPDTKYATGSEVHYPDADSAAYKCILPHRSKESWEPPNARMLWKRIEE